MKNLLNISDLNKDDFDSILNFANSIEPYAEDCLKNKNIGLIFEKIQLEPDFLFKSALIN